LLEPVIQGNCKGVTLLEVLAAIFIMGVGMLPTLTLFPTGALSMRQAINEGRAADDAVTLSSTITDFQTYELRLPVSLSELTPYLNGDRRFEDGEEYGYSFSMDTDGAVTAEPVSPGKTGVRCFRKPLGESLVDCTTPAAIERARQAERIMFDNILALTAEASADVLRLDTSGRARALARPFCTTQPLSSAFAAMDVDYNGLIDWQELLAPDPSIPRVSAFHSRVAFELELGAGDENLDAFPGLSITAFQGDPCFVYTFDTLRFLVARYVASHGLQTSLIAELDAAERASAMGNVSAKSALLEAFANQIRAQQGKALTARDAGVLITLAGTL
jgi:prepilin-type N-terminal cleavage/methylation domain-containing protein